MSCSTGPFSAARKKTGATYLERRNAVRTGMNILAEGRSLAFLMDQRVKSGVEVSFFGRNSIMTSFPARLAVRWLPHRADGYGTPRRP